MGKVRRRFFTISFKISLVPVRREHFAKWKFLKICSIVNLRTLIFAIFSCYTVAMKWMSDFWQLLLTHRNICHHHVKTNSVNVLMKRVCRYCFHVHSLQAPRRGWEYSSLKLRLPHVILYVRGHCHHLQHSIVIETCIRTYVAVFIMDHVIQTIVFDSLCHHSGSDQHIILYV